MPGLVVDDCAAALRVGGTMMATSDGVSTAWLATSTPSTSTRIEYAPCGTLRKVKVPARSVAIVCTGRMPEASKVTVHCRSHETPALSNSTRPDMEVCGRARAKFAVDNRSTNAAITAGFRNRIGLRSFPMLDIWQE